MVNFSISDCGYGSRGENEKGLTGVKGVNIIESHAPKQRYDFKLARLAIEGGMLKPGEVPVERYPPSRTNFRCSSLGDAFWGQQLQLSQAFLAAPGLPNPNALRVRKLIKWSVKN